MKLPLIKIALAWGTMILSATSSLAVTIDLTSTTTGTIGDVVFTRVDTQPTGTGVFKPFLTLQNSPTEQGYNTSGADVFNTKRTPQWNHDLTLGDLAVFNGYYVFELDANEKGKGNIGKLLSIDNIAIYTSSIGSQTTQTFDANGFLQFQNGTLRYTLNSPNTPGAPMDNWVKIDATLGSTSGSGSSDLRVFVPTSYFAGALSTDFLYFYNLNGVHYGAEIGTASEAGFEEWRALTGPNTPPPPPPPSVPDGGTPVALLGGALLAAAGIRRLLA